MTTTDLPRLNNAQLTEIGQRLNQPLTDEGARAWYRNDVNALVAEVLYLRRDHSKALSIYQQNPPLHDIPAAADMATIAQWMAEVWVQQEAGLWKTAENRKLRDRAQAAQEAASAAQQQTKVLEGQIAHLRTENAQIAVLQDRLVLEQSRVEQATRHAETLAADILALNEQIGTLTQHRDHLQKVANAQLAEIRKRDQVAAQTRQLLNRVPEQVRAETTGAPDAVELEALHAQIATLTRHRDHLQAVANGQLTQIRTLSALTDKAKTALEEATAVVRQQTPADEQRYAENDAIQHQAQLTELQEQVRMLIQHRDHLQTVANAQLTELHAYQEVTTSARGLLEG